VKVCGESFCIFLFKISFSLKSTAQHLQPQVAQTHRVGRNSSNLSGLPTKQRWTISQMDDEDMKIFESILNRKDTYCAGDDLFVYCEVASFDCGDDISIFGFFMEIEDQCCVDDLDEKTPSVDKDEMTYGPRYSIGTAVSKDLSEADLEMLLAERINDAKYDDDGQQIDCNIDDSRDDDVMVDWREAPSLVTNC
jgi:hypothetical protein